MKSNLKNYNYSLHYTYKYLAEYENEVPPEIPTGIRYRHLYKYHGARPENKYYPYDSIRMDIIKEEIVPRLKRPQGGAMMVYIQEMKKQKRSNNKKKTENKDDILGIGRAEWIYQWTKLTDREKQEYEKKYQQLRKEFAEYSKLYPILSKNIIKKRNRTNNKKEILNIHTLS